MIKILHTGDWHLRGQDIDEAKECLDLVIAKAEEADVVVMTGDITDRRHTLLDSYATWVALSTFEELAYHCPVIICSGTPYHEGNIAEKMRVASNKHPVIPVVGRPDIVELDINGEKAVFSVIPQPTKQYIDTLPTIEETDDRLKAGMSGVFMNLAMRAARMGAKYHVGVGHFTIGGAYISETQQMIGRDIEISREQLYILNFELCCMGHIHKAQRIGARTFYAGSLYSLTAGELDQKGFYMHTLDDGLQSEFIATPARPRVVVDLDFTAEGKALNDESQIEAALATETIPPNAKLHIRLRAWADATVTVSQETIERILKDIGVHPYSLKFEPIRVPRQNLRAQSILAATNLRSKVYEMARTKGETVPESILDKADLLEGEPDEDKILESVRLT